MRKMLLVSVLLLSILPLSRSVADELQPGNHRLACGDFSLVRTSLHGTDEQFILKNKNNSATFTINLTRDDTRMPKRIVWSPSCHYILFLPYYTANDWMLKTLVIFDVRNLSYIEPSGLETVARKNGEKAFPFKSDGRGLPAIDDSGKYLALPCYFDSYYGVFSYWNLETGRRFLDVETNWYGLLDIQVEFVPNQPWAIERKGVRTAVRDLKSGQIINTESDGN